MVFLKRCVLAAGVTLTLGGCVMQSTYNSMLAQQQAIESSLRSEIAADQVKIQQLENGIRVTMSEDLLYPSGGVELSREGRAALDKVVPALQQNQMEIDVIGNTDSVPVGPELAGRYPTNWELAGERADVIVRYLQHKGVDPTRLRGISAGQYHPVATDDTAAGRKQNRRTDLLLRPR